MLKLSDGFDVGEAVFPWGTTLAEVSEHFNEAGAEADEGSLKLLEQSVMGLPTLSVTVTAPALDRPVLSAAYKLKYDPACQSEDCIVGRLSLIFGEPSSRRSHRIMGAPEAGVSCVAEWDFGSFDVKMSIYGAPRKEAEGLSVGIFWVSWMDEITASAPYIQELEEADAKLSRQAENAVCLGRISIHIEQDWRYKDSYPFRNSHLDWKHDNLSKARRALGRVQLRATPLAISNMLKEGQVIVWKSESLRVWCISNKNESVWFDLDAWTEASYTDFLPAKGGGATYFTIGPLQILGGSKSEALSDLAGILENHQLATISYSAPYDC